MIFFLPAGNRPKQGLYALLVAFSTVFAAASVNAQTLAASQSLTGVWSSSTTWADIDNDGDADLLITGLTGPANNCVPIATIYRNDGGTLVQHADLVGIHSGTGDFADYDGDGDLDLALSGVTSSGAGTVILYRNDSGTFNEDLTQSGLQAETMRYTALAWGDYDGDGDSDLLISGLTAAGNARTVLLNNGRIDASRVGSPLGGASLLSIDTPNSERLLNLNQGNVAWGDLDGDGDLDLALTGYGTDGSRQAALYLNEPLGTLTLDTRNTRLPPISGGDLAWADYDNDGDLDLALSGWNTNWESTFQIFTNAAGILREDLTFSSRRIVGSIAWGDIDNDGDLDLAVAGQTNTSERLSFVLLNDPPGVLTENSGQTLTGARGGDLAWADVDGDGHSDLVLSGEVDGESRETTVYVNQGGSTANTPPEPPDRLGTPFVTSGGVSLDWNDGTDTETISTAITYNLRIGTTTGDNDVFSGAIPTGPGNVGSSKTLTLALPVARDTYFWSVSAVDPGFAVSAESQEEIFRVQDLVSSSQNLRPLRDAALEWGDFDNDNDPDLILSGRDVDGRGRSILYRNDNGTLVEHPQVVLQGLLSGDAAWGDYDNDGDLDLALTGTDASLNKFTHLYRNRLELGDFALNITNVQILAQLGSGDIDWGDYDNDGDLDLAVMGQVTGARLSTIYRNDSGDFTEDTAVALTGADNGDLGWGDYDNDGDLDLAIIGQISNDFQTTLKIYRNEPIGTLTEDTRSTLSGSFASSLAWGDHDSDGDLDLVVSGFDLSVNGRVTRLYDNDGTGIMTENAQAFTGGAATDVEWGDFDNDGDLDLALLGNGASGPILDVYRNQAGSFDLQPIDVLRGVDFGALGWADIDTDGDLDLLSAGRSSEDGIRFELTTRANDNLESRFNPNEPPQAPTGLTSSTSGADISLSWLPGQDQGNTPTPTVALTYEVRLGSETGSNDIRSGVSAVEFGSVRGTSLILNNLPSGAYFWSTRTIDAGLAKSDFSEESMFIVDTISPVVDSVQVRPRILAQGRRASVVVDFNDAPAGMDNSIAPVVTINLANQPEPLVLSQLSYSGDLWIGEANVNVDVPAGSFVVRVTGGTDLKGNTMDPFERTIPALIAPGGGGVVESPDGVLSLRISPNVLPANLTENPDVRIDPVPVGAEPSGVTASHGAYEITSDPPLTLRKPATLNFQIPEGSNRDRLAVYQLTGATWTRLGGTVTGDRFRVPVTDLSIYGLFEDSTTPAGSASITNIDFSNRAFSPTGPRRQGGGAPGGLTPLLLRTTDISFDLSATANVRIEIYNRSGQLQIILVPGQQMNAGRNVVTWDGLDHENTPARSGLYIVSIEAGGEREQKTVAVVNR
jgi:hypothetical protein